MKRRSVSFATQDYKRNGRNGSKTAAKTSRAMSAMSSRPILFSIRVGLQKNRKNRS